MPTLRALYVLYQKENARLIYGLVPLRFLLRLEYFPH